MGSKHESQVLAITQGGIVKKEAPLQISNLSLIDPKSGRDHRVGF